MNFNIIVISLCVLFTFSPLLPTQGAPNNIELEWDEKEECDDAQWEHKVDMATIVPKQPATDNYEEISEGRQ